MSDLSNKVIGNYQIEKLLGQGGMGAVYRARDIQLQRLVAFKMMHPEIAAHEDLRKRFLQEARAIALLDHPNIVKIFSFHGDKNELYLVMEYVVGGSLREYLKHLQSENKLIEIPEAVALIRQMSSALHYAHAQGMIHRDVKPDNVLLKMTSGTDKGVRFNALLTDFGLAKLAENAVVQTAGHNPMGTLPYMPPEQIRGEHMDGRTDLYALGIMMYELFVGRLPFTPRNIPEAARMHGSEDPPRPTSLRSGLSPEIEKIILKAISKHPNDRFQTGQEIIDALDEMEAKADSPDPEDNLATYIDPSVLDSGKEASLGTYLASIPGVPDFEMEIPEPSAELEADQLVILREGHSAQYVQVKKQELMIGRDPTHDVTLQGDKVSRNHARIERKADGSYIITDLGSTNGTYIDEAKLLSNVPEPWDITSQVVSIGDFRLSIQKANVQQTQVGVQGVESLADVRPAGIGPSGARADRDKTHPITGTSADAGPQVGVQVLPPAVTVDPGTQATAQVEIYNQSNIVEHYRVTIQGIPQEWFTSPTGTLQLLPGSRGTLPLVFHPPRNPKSTAGTHTFGLRVASQERGEEIGRGTGILTIKPFHQYTVNMEPKRISRRGTIRYFINNMGNAPDSYTVVGRDREDGLNFFPPSASGSVGPGLREAVEVEVRPRRGNLIGTARTYPFEMAAESSMGMSQMQNGELVHPALLPIWLLSLLFVLCLVCGILAFVLFINQEPEAEDMTAQNALTATNEDIRGLLTSTAINFETLEASRSITATAIAQLDDDNDGLTNAEEQDAGTDPNRADSDGDGLEDGEEINEYDTDPLSADTDRDGLQDGAEIEEGADPKKEDTDNDGLLDGDEIIRYQTEPAESDTDGDGIQDGVEVNELGTDPTKFDTDGDRRGDGVDGDPLDPNVQ